MSRLPVAALGLALAVTACTKTAASQESNTAPNGPEGRIPAPGEKRVAPPGGGDTVQANTGDNPQLRLSPDEGQLAVQAPSGAKAGAEVTAKVDLTANEKYKVNVEFPTKLTLETPKGVTIAKAVLKAGGHDKSKGDAEVFDDKQLTFLVKLTPSASGTYTINGSFKFAVCDRGGTQCLPKTEPIAIQVAAQ